MRKFAVLDNNYVINLIIADSKEIAESVTGKECIENPSGDAGVGSFWNGSIFIPKKPDGMNSWILDSENKWVPPTEIPNDGFRYYWDESKLSWLKEPGQ